MKVKDEKLFGASDKVYADSKAKGLYNESQDILDTLKQRKNAIIRMITKYNDLKDDAKVKEYEDKLREVERRIDNYSNSDKPMKMQEADKEDFESDMAHIEEFLNTKDGYATPEAEQILDTLYDDFITLSSKVHLDESADYPEDEKLTIDKYVATYKMPNGTFFELYKDEDGNMYDQNKVPIDAEELSKYEKVTESKKLNEDAWDDNFVINMLTDEKVYWKRKSDGKEIVTSFDIFKEPTDPTEWKSEEELTKYALEEAKDIAMNYEDAGSDIEAVLIALYKANCFNIDNLMNFIKDTQEYLTEASRLPNISKFVYDLDKDKGDAWSVNSYTEDNKGNKIIIVTKNGKSENTDKDIINAVEKKYPQLKGYETENHKGVWFYLNENNLNENIKESLVKKEEGDINPLNANDEDTVKINVAYKIAITYYQARNPHKIKKEKMYSAFNRVYVPINIVKDYVNGKLTYEEFKDAIFKLLWDYYVDWSKENKNTLKELELYKITWIGNIPDDVKEKLLDNTNENNLKESIDTSEYTHKDSKFKYMLLDRLKQDCEYFLGNGNGAEKVFEGIDIDEELVEETKTSDKLFDQLKELGMTKEQAESTVKAIVNIFKNKSPEIVKESAEDVLDNLSNETVDKVSDIISKIKNLGWDGNIDTIEDYYNKLFVKESKTLKKEAITELSNELYEIVEYMYNESEQDLDYIPEIEDIQDSVNEDCDENMYNKAVDIVRNIIENITYYEYDYKKYIQLSDNHTMYELNDDVEMTADQYSSLVDIFLQQLQDEINIDIYALGRSGRHICIDNTFDNALNYNGYVQAQRKYEQEMINYINQEYGNNKTENKKLNEDIKSNKYEIEWNAGAVERTPTPNETVEFEGTRADLMKFLDDNYVDVDYDEDDNIISFEEWLDTYEDTYDPSGSTVVLSIKENGKEIYKNSDYDYYQKEQEDYDDDDDDDDDMEESKHLNEAEEDIIEQSEETDNNILDLLQNRIGQNLTVGELNTILQGVLGKYNEVYLLTSDLYNMNPEEPQELVVFDDDDMYTITYNIEDMDNAIIQITDVELD